MVYIRSQNGERLIKPIELYCKETEVIAIRNIYPNDEVIIGKYGSEKRCRMMIDEIYDRVRNGYKVYEMPRS